VVQIVQFKPILGCSFEIAPILQLPSSLLSWVFTN